ncbi:MAG: rRNA maturation RNase YbeY [Opitutales bacterium]|nr:rRNA maturation RNase YbeY [Opitutales bacterium]
MTRSVEILNEVPGFRIDDTAVKKLIQTLDEFEAFSIPSGHLDIAYVTDERCCSLHKDHFDDPSITDVMTFPGDPGDEHAGDIAICPQYAAEACLDHGTSFPEEVTLYLIHAWLHLAGFDDLNENSHTAMRDAEERLMNYVLNTCGLPACTLNNG